MDSIRSVLKTTEELVTQARLNQIAREHRSIGSILDDREIFALEVIISILVNYNKIYIYLYNLRSNFLNINLIGSTEKWEI